MVTCGFALDRKGASCASAINRMDIPDGKGLGLILAIAVSGWETAKLRKPGSTNDRLLTSSIVLFSSSLDQRPIDHAPEILARQIFWLCSEKCQFFFVVMIDYLNPFFLLVKTNKALTKIPNIS